MNEVQYQEILAMLTVIYKKVDEIDNKLRGGSRMASDQTFLNELREKAERISQNIRG